MGTDLTKHEQIIRHIKSLNVNTKVSVRQIARELEVSEGTAYRAIKGAESQGLVSSIPKVGTIRIQSEEEREIEDLTLREIARIVDGEILTGEDCLDIVPSRFVVGSNSVGVLKKYLSGDALLIVGDIYELQVLAVERNTHLFIAGAFKISQDVIDAAQRRGLVIISSPYDTFEAVSVLSRSLYERLTEKELLLVEDIMVTNVHYLTADDTVEDWHRLSQQTGHSRFPVVDQNMMVVGIITAVDVAGMDKDTSVLSLMTSDVLKVEARMLVTHLSRVLLWEGFELVPIVKKGRLIGVVSRQDILQAFQQMQKQPQVGETIDNLVMSGFKLEKWEEGTRLTGEITQFMINEYGSASPGVIAMILTTTAYIAVRKQLKMDTFVNEMTMYHMEPLEVGGKVDAYARIINYEKKSCVVDLNVYCNSKLKVKGILSLRFVKK